MPDLSSSEIKKQPADPIPQGPEILVVEGQTPNAVIELDGLLQPDFRLFHAPVTLA